MKRKIAISILGVFAAMGLSGCLLYTSPGHSQTAASRGAPGGQCHPSQHWENGHCVHNGQGRGARKHDD
jgi:hypothetical protein